MGVVQNENGSDATFGQVHIQFVIVRPFVIALRGFSAFPAKVHANEFESSGGDEVEVALVAGDKMNVNADPGGKNGRGEFGGKDCVCQEQ